MAGDLDTRFRYLQLVHPSVSQSRFAQQLLWLQVTKEDEITCVPKVNRSRNKRQFEVKTVGENEKFTTLESLIFFLSALVRTGVVLLLERVKVVLMRIPPPATGC